MLKKSGVLCVLAVAALIGLGAGAGLAQDKVYVNGFDAAYHRFRLSTRMESRQASTSMRWIGSPRR